jgi:SAM-dependent methyltransferase
MVAEAQVATPAARFSVMSATDLAFANGTFDYVLFSARGIDCIAPRAKRGQTLRELYRVLRPGGVLIYPAHSWPGFVLTALWSRSRRGDLLRNVSRGRLLPGYFRIRQAGGDLVLHYGLPGAEARALRAVGFGAVRVLPGKISPRLARLGRLAQRLFDVWPYYVAVK